MKIFSLQTKTSLVIWSIIIGLAVNYFVMNYYNIFAGNQSVIDGDIKNLPKFWLNFYDADATCYHVGWPLKIKRCLEVNENVPSYYQKNFYVNALTYIGLSFIGLSLIKYFRIKKLITNH